MKLIHSIKENCTQCFACVKICPAKAIKIEDGYAQASESRCVGCGHCVTICSTKALYFKRSVTAVEKLLLENDKVIAICAPSIAGEFEDISSRRNFVGMIKALGFEYVCEAAFGADLVGHKYKELIGNFKGKYYITTNCPVVPYYVEKYHPNTIQNLAPIVTPTVATAIAARNRYGSDAKVVYIGPCTAAKLETERFEGDAKIDEVLTFIELRAMFKQYEITENSVEYSFFDPPRGAKGSLFPISGGFLEAVKIDTGLLNGRIVCTEGRYNFIEAIKEFENLHKLKKHIDLFYCDGGCTMGPGTTPGGKKFLRRSQVIEFTKKQLETLDISVWEKDIEENLKLDLSRKYRPDDQRKPMPKKQTVLDTLKDLGKEEDCRRLNCGACGYESCIEFAVAVDQELASPEMCISNSRSKSLQQDAELRQLKEGVEELNTKLTDTERKLLLERESADVARNTTQLMLNKIPSGVIMIDKDLKIIHSNKHFIDLLGDDAKDIADVIPGLKGADLKTLLPNNSINYFKYAIEHDDEIENRDIKIGDKLLNLSVFSIKKGKMAGAVIRDMYLPEVQREEALARITDVIDKNLKMVQNIGFLLGEGAADTEKMLRSIIDSYNTNKK